MTSEKAHKRLLLAAVFAYVLFGVGRAVGAGLCFEADGHVEIEVMRAGSCAPSKFGLDQGHDEHHTEHAGLASDEHCVSCTDVSLPMQELRAKRMSDELGTPMAFPITISSLLMPTPHKVGSSYPQRSNSPLLSSLSTIVLRT